MFMIFAALSAALPNTLFFFLITLNRNTFMADTLIFLLLEVVHLIQPKIFCLMVEDLKLILVYQWLVILHTVDNLLLQSWEQLLRGVWMILVMLKLHQILAMA